MNNYRKYIGREVTFLAFDNHCYVGRIFSIHRNLIHIDYFVPNLGTVNAMLTVPQAKERLIVQM